MVAKHLLTCVLAAGLAAIPATAQDTPARTFQAGAATSNITPWLGVSIAGHMNDRAATRVHDELHARALVIDDSQTQLVFVLVDSCMVPREVIDAAKERASSATGIAATHMLMAATHTHSAACATPIFQSDPDPNYQQYLAAKIADAVTIAAANRVPARIGWTAGSLPDEVFNRRWYMKAGTALPNPFGGQDKVKMNPPRASEDLVEPAGPTDPAVPVLAVADLEGRPIAVLANYALHYVGGVGGGEISADYFGMFAKALSAMLDVGGESAPVVILSNGTSGDINNINFREPAQPAQPYEQMRKVAHKLAGEVFRAYQDIEFHDWVELDAAQREVRLGVRLPGTEELEKAKAIVAAADGPEMRGLEQIYARETVLLSAYPETVPVVLQTFRVGELGFAAIPCEVFVEIGLDIKARSPYSPTAIIELANGYNGYLPTAKHHELGGYETWRARSSYLETGAADTITNVVLELFAELAGREGQ